MTLTDFLLARIAEDETRVRTPLGDEQYWQNSNPRRVLAECEAKRRIVYRRMNAENTPGVAGSLLTATLDAVLLDLVLPYADHPDYREEWKP